MYKALNHCNINVQEVLATPLKHAQLDLKLTENGNNFSSGSIVKLATLEISL